MANDVERRWAFKFRTKLRTFRKLFFISSFRSVDHVKTMRQKCPENIDGWAKGLLSINCTGTSRTCLNYSWFFWAMVLNMNIEVQSRNETSKRLMIRPSVPDSKKDEQTQSENNVDCLFRRQGYCSQDISTSKQIDNAAYYVDVLNGLGKIIIWL